MLIYTRVSITKYYLFKNNSSYSLLINIYIAYKNNLIIIVKDVIVILFTLLFLIKESKLSLIILFKLVTFYTILYTI